MGDCGLLSKKNVALPLKSVNVNAFVQGCVVGLESRLKYVNEDSDPAEVLFRTPLDEALAVVALTAVIDGRRIRADLKEKERATEMYDDAITSGRSAALGEEKKGDIFSIALGNLPPGKEADIELTMVGELSIDAEGSVRLSLPTVLKPRYAPSGAQDPLSPVQGGERGQVKHAKAPPVHHLTVHVSGADDIAEVSSPSHKLKTRTQNNMIQVEIDGEPSSSDIVILIQPKHPHHPSVLVEPGRPAADNTFMAGPAVMMSFFPEFKGDNSEVACEFVFVVDRSGSMSGSYIRQAGETLVLFLKSIPEGCFFNVIGFGSRYEKLFEESVPYNQENMEKAVRHAESFQANLGGTELLPPLEYVFSQRLNPHLTRQVFVLTDGSISNTEAVVQLVRKNADKARCFSFGIGSGASTDLVRGIAEAGLGTAEFITGGERMQPKVIHALKRAMQPAVTSVSVTFDLPPGYSVRVAPEQVPLIFRGERTVVYAVLERAMEGEETKDTTGSVNLSGELLGSKAEHRMMFQLPVEGAFAGGSVSTIHHLAGKSLIKEYQRKNRPKSDVVKLSCKSGVVSKHTAFIAIDEEQREPVQGSLKVWDVQAEYEERDVSEFPFIVDCWDCDSDGIDDSDAENFYDDCEDLSMVSTNVADDVYSCTNTAFRYHVEPSSCTSRKLLSPRCRNEGDSMTTGPPRARGSSSPPSSSSSSKPTLPQVIGLQLASGAWELTAPLAVLLGGTVEQLKASCPVPCEGSLQTLWATALALAFLKNKMADSQKEWELVAAKAENWLRRQGSPEVTIETLQTTADQVVSCS